MPDPTTLSTGEPHPQSHSALAYIKVRLMTDPSLRESLASCALSGNRSAEVCYGTMERIRNGEPVSDRYVLGLAWLLKELEDLGGSAP